MKENVPAQSTQAKEEITNQRQEKKTGKQSLRIIQSKQGKQPPIQAKQRPINKTNPEPRTIDPFKPADTPIQQKPNNAGLPDRLKSGVENLSGYSMDDVKVHYNSDKPAQLQAHAYTQGNDIHLAAGQEKHLPHEAWHVVQQKQGRVRPTVQMKGKVNINDDAGLEKEADVMGEKAVKNSLKASQESTLATQISLPPIVQRATYVKAQNGQAYKDREYIRAKNGGETEDEVGMKDEKMQVLHEFANDLTNKIYQERLYPGPHIAVSVFKKTLYVAVNTKGTNDIISKDELAPLVKNVVDEWSITLNNTTIDNSLVHAVAWLVKAGTTNIEIFGGENSGSGTLHGEMRILKHIDTKNKLDNIDNSHKHYTGNAYKKVIRLGGTQLDCADCHQREHGGRNQHGHAVSRNSFCSKKSYDNKFAAKGYQILSPGTHGDSFPGWRDPLTTYINNVHANNVLSPTQNDFDQRTSGHSMEKHIKHVEIEALEMKLKSLEDEVDEKTDRPAKSRSLASKIGGLTERINTLNIIKDEYLMHIQAWEAEVPELETKLGVGIAPIDTSKDLGRQYRQSIRRKKNAEARVKAYKDRIRQLNNLAEDDNVQPVNLKNQLTTALDNAIGVETEHLEQKNNEKENASRELIHLVIRHSSIKQELRSLLMRSEKHQKVKQRKTALKNQRKNLATSEVEHLTRSVQLSEKTQALENQRQNLKESKLKRQKQSTQLSKKTQALENKRVEIEQQKKQQQRQEANQRTVEEKLAKQHGILEGLDQKRAELQGKLDSLSETLTNTESSHHKLTAELDLINQELTILEQEITKIMQDSSSPEKAEAEEINATDTQQLIEKQNRQRVLQEEKEAKEAAINEANQQLSSIDASLKKQQYDLTMTKNSYNETQTEIKLLDKSIQETQQDLNNSKKILLKLQKEFRALKIEQRETQHKIQILENKIKRLDKLIADLEKTIQAMKTVDQEAKQKKEEFNIIQEEIASIQQLLQDLINELQELS